MYRATDPSLNRDVAIKVLPAHVAAVPERRARFEREARMAAALNHPGIVTIHSVEHDGGRVFITMELVQGERLADLIPRHGLSIDKLLAIAVPLTAAVSAAHDSGITHRDLKPANVLVGDDGAVKVLDFGIAKRHDADAATATAATATLATAEGSLLGTVAYMSPEQAEGKPADKRSDVFSLGTMLYEMATGRRPFAADTAVATLAAIVRDAPVPIADVNPRVPRELARVIRRALAKEPDRRQQSAKDLRNELDDLRREFESGELALAAVVGPPRRPAVWILAIACVVAALGATALWPRREASTVPASTTRLTILPPDGATEIRYPVISSDGSQVAFVARVDGTAAIWVRQLDSLRARSLSGTQGAQFPFWSTDGRFLAFFADGKLKKIALAGGSPQILCDAPQGRGGSWNQDDVIIFAPGVGMELHRVSATGGQSTPLTTLATSPPEQGHRLPHFLPDGRHFVFAAWGLSGERSIALGSLDSPQTRRIVSTSLGDAYLAGNHLVFARDDGTLVAQLFDLERATLAGEAFPLAEDIESNNAGSMRFSVASSGELVYSTRSQRFSQLTWVDRQGRHLGTVGAPAEHEEFYPPALTAPDARRAALTVRFPETNFDIVVQDLTSGQATKLTSDPSGDQAPVWAPDGERLVFSSHRDGLAASQLYETTIEAGRERPLVPGRIIGNINPQAWSPDGEHLLIYREIAQASSGLWILPLIGDRTPRRWFEEQRQPQRHPSFSPDGRWIAYALGVLNNGEIFIRSLTDPSIGRRVAEGEWARWRGDGRELFYFDLSTRQLMAVDVHADATSVNVGTPHSIFHVPRGLSYDVTRDGSRFLFIIEVERKLSQMHVVHNWQQDVRR